MIKYNEKHMIFSHLEFDNKIVFSNQKMLKSLKKKQQQRIFYWINSF